MTPGADTRIPYLLALTIWLAALALGAWRDLGARIEYPLLDWNLRQLAARAAPDPDIVLLDIDEATLEAMAPEYGRYPWTRAVYGALIEGLARQRPAAIVFDILLTDPHREHAADDLYLIATARRTPNAFFSMLRLPPATDALGVPLRDLPGVERTAAARDEARAALALPLPGLAATGRIGAINAETDVDGVLRRYPLYHPVDGWRIPSLPARVAAALGYARPDTDSLALLWHGPERSYRTLSLHEVLFDLERRAPQRPPDEFAGKIVIVGASAAGLSDLKLTPLSPRHPGPEVIATALDNLKHGERLRFAPRGSAEFLTALALAILAYAFTRGMGVLHLGLLALGISAALVASATAGVLWARYALPATLPLVFGVWLYYVPLALRAWLLERRDRQRVTQLFGRFLDPRVVAELVAARGADVASGGERREITVLFSDIRGFTTLSERKTPQEVVELLNRYFRLQVEVIFRHQGTLDKYIGDAIMAFWGAPTDQPDHARRALEAARDMELTLARFKQELGAAGRDFDVGIGLASGEAVVGFIGSPEHRQDYTVIGDTVNTASRIEGATKGRARILVSQATRDAVGSSYRFRDHGGVALKGKEAKVRLFEPLWSGDDENSSDRSRRTQRAAARRRGAGERTRQHAR
jgi:adenylate cyclase